MVHWLFNRSGTDADAANLYQKFKELEFEIHMFNNKTVQEMMNIMIDGEADCTCH